MTAADSEQYRKLKKMDGHMRDHLEKKISKFYYKTATTMDQGQGYLVNKEIHRELDNDYETDELEEICKDEQQDETKYRLEADNKELSQDYASNIYDRMSKMSDTYRQITDTMEKNLQNVQTYIK